MKSAPDSHAMREEKKFPPAFARPVLPTKPRLSLAPQGVALDIGAVRRVHARLPLGLPEAHLHVSTRGKEAVDDHESEHRDGIEDVLPVWCGACQLILFCHESMYPGIYLHPFVHVRVAVSALRELDLAVE